MFYDAIARYYDAENHHFTDDLPLYTELAEEYGSPILDIGCGTGRVNLHLAQAGYETVGVDLSAEMLAIAQRKINTMPHLVKRAKLIHADILNFQEGRYPLILLPYNALMHFTHLDQQVKLFQNLHQLLAEDGVIVIDLPNAGEAYAAEDIQGMVLERMFIEPISGNMVMQQSVSHINRAEQLLSVTWIYDEILPDKTLKRTVEPLQLRYSFPAELRLLLHQCGLNIIEMCGDYDQNPFADGAERMIVIASHAE